MRILITVDPEIPVPPTDYGGIERIVDALAKAYFHEGNDVYLVANPNSTNQEVRKLFGWPYLNSRGLRNIVGNSRYLLKVCDEIKPEIIHSFSRLLYLYPLFLKSKMPVLQSYQRAISDKSTKIANWLGGNQLSFSSCGQHMVNGHAVASKISTIHNFTNINFFNINKNASKDHLMYLGRIEEKKGTKQAVDVALATNQKLIIAGNIQPGHEDYFENFIKSHLGNPLIEYVGPVNDIQKRTYLQSAKALLFPVQWDEPFGIVMVEAMACGVPVIGFRKGAVKEVIIDGETGYIVDTVSEMVEAVNKLDLIDPDQVRKRCAEYFSAEVISRKYLDMFNSALA